MLDRMVTLTYRLGLHMRPAEKLVRLASSFESEVMVGCQPGVTVNAKSILGVLSLAAMAGSVLTFKAEGADAEQALDSLVALVASEFKDDD